MGASIAYHVASRGFDVLLLERARICAGPTRHSTALIRVHYTQPLLVRMALHGLQSYSAFRHAIGADSGFTRTGMLFAVAASDRGRLEQNVAVGQAEGAATQLLESDEVRRLEPRLAVDDLVFCFEPEAGYCDPYQVTAGYAAAARRAGAATYEGVPVEAIAPGEVGTAQGPVAAETIVVAAGPWSPSLLTPLGYELPVLPARAEVARFRLPADFGPSPPAVADFSDAQLYFRPAEPGFLEVGSLDPRHADAPLDPDHPPEGAEEATLRWYEQGLAKRLPAADGGHWRGAWSGVYDVTPDWEPALGPVPGVEGIYVAAGFSGHGFKLAPAVGLSLAELLSDGRTTFDLELLAPDRFARGELVGARYGYSVLG